MNNNSTILKLIAGFIIILLALQLWNFFKPPSPPTKMEDIKSELARIDSLNSAIKNELKDINKRTELVDKMLQDELTIFLDNIKTIKGDISAVKKSSSLTQQRVDTLIGKLKNSGAPVRIPTLDELKKAK